MRKICTQLASQILTGADNLRDMYAIGIKTVIRDVIESSTDEVAQCLVIADKSPILQGIVGDVPEVKIECMVRHHDVC